VRYHGVNAATASLRARVSQAPPAHTRTYFYAANKSNSAGPRRRHGQRPKPPADEHSAGIEKTHDDLAARSNKFFNMIHPAYSPIKRPFGILTALSTATEEVHYITKACELVNTAVAMKGQASFFNKMNPAYSPLARPLFLSATTGEV
jgi:hypothetical protein